MTDLARRCAELIRDVPDYPAAGVMFKDITPLLADGPTFGAVVEHFADVARRAGGVDLVAGMEARGFIMGAPVASALGIGFVPVRKAGKLPGPIMGASYDLEYGSATVEVHPATIEPGARVLVVDDVLATGGTAAATSSLIERAGGVVVGLAFLLELTFLPGRSMLGTRSLDVILSVD
ncbi:adenine phosphoribosyltransferase [Pengzhenrongella sicca]|uniref:Adenine phosphoribosyltransferase n=1 Tax=Pengzhenrongella sicca TaxID=2819238 RepID=A0A8A4ZC11_9MICO|nr:adenine phosphoribosyltransferase [Pengzhenrongella sicca]QTE28037.1 adenine phosphoribosyltransferase [Pengzhenrongella sicca]